jgi:hypothetical protein
LSKILGDIRKQRCTTGINDTGINDTGSKFATGVNMTGRKFVAGVNYGIVTAQMGYSGALGRLILEKQT